MEEFWDNPRVVRLQAEIAEAESENERLSLALQLFKAIKESSGSVVNQLSEGMMINNFDEVKASLHNELLANTKRLEKALKGIVKSNEEQGRILSAVMAKNDKMDDSEFQTIKIRKSRDKVHVTNLDEISMPKDVSVDNLEEIRGYLQELGERLSKSLNVEVKPPEVIVNAPEVKIPETVIPDFDLSPLKDQLKKISQSLTKIKNNRETNPLAVRLSDGEEFIEELRTVAESAKSAFAGFPGAVSLAPNATVTLKGAGTPTGGRATVASAGTAVQLKTTSTPCKEVLLSADLGNTGIVVVGGSDVDATNDSQNGMVIIPGNAPTRLSIKDVSDLWVDAQTNGDSVCFVYVN